VGRGAGEDLVTDALRTDVFSGVVGQDEIVGQLRAAVRAPVHAYLLVGPPGAGSRVAATAFSAALLCPDGGCGVCRDCRLALAGEHPDALDYEPEGAFLRKEDGEEIIRLAVRSPVEGRRKVLILHRMHHIQAVGPMLLKTIEEPPASTVFVLLADSIVPELVTIASRCVRLVVPPRPAAAIEAALLLDGVAPDRAASAARAAVGSLDRARVLAGDEHLAGRRAAWHSVASRLDGTGAAVAVLVAELEAAIEAAAAPLAARQQVELDALDARLAEQGERGGGRRQLVERHRRELRRHRADELRFGLATLASAYRDALVAGGAGGSGLTAKPLVEGLTAIDAAAESLPRNPNETLLLQALFLRLPSLD
jgi:DNA polymerase-3 subunit delta'